MKKNILLIKFDKMLSEPIMLILERAKLSVTIVLSTYTDNIYRSLYFEMGVSDYILKPFE